MSIEFGKLDKETASFIDKHIDSFVKWDLITFFNYNPNVTGTVVEIAGRLGRGGKDVEEALEDLVRDGLLKKQREGKDIIYSYEPSSDLKERATSFVRCLEDRTKRLQILAKLLRMRSGQSGE